jgi:hypothetical protein
MLLSQCNDELNWINSDCMALCYLGFVLLTTLMLTGHLSESYFSVRDTVNMHFSSILKITFFLGCDAVWFDKKIYDQHFGGSCCLRLKSRNMNQIRKKWYLIWEWKTSTRTESKVLQIGSSGEEKKKFKERRWGMSCTYVMNR